MRRLEQAQRLMAKWGISYVDAIQDYRYFVSEALRSSSKSFLLDACCGADSSSIKGLNATGRNVGLDLNPASLKKNTCISDAVMGNLTALPFKNDSFQAVSLHWGIEHISRPLSALKEAYRVLKPGGRVVIMTTNIWSPFYFLAKITPHVFHKFVRKRLLETGEEGVCRTYYRANTPFKMKKLLRQAGFSKIALRYRGNPASFAFFTITFLLGLLYESITDFFIFKYLKMFIVSSGDKPIS